MPNSTHDRRLRHSVARRVSVRPLPTFLKYSAKQRVCGVMLSLGWFSIRSDSWIRCFITASTASSVLTVLFTLLACDISARMLFLWGDAIAVAASWFFLSCCPPLLKFLSLRLLKLLVRLLDAVQPNGLQKRSSLFCAYLSGWFHQHIVAPGIFSEGFLFLESLPLVVVLLVVISYVKWSSLVSLISPVLWSRTVVGLSLCGSFLSSNVRHLVR